MTYIICEFYWIKESKKHYLSFRNFTELLESTLNVQLIFVCKQQDYFEISISSKSLKGINLAFHFVMSFSKSYCMLNLN